MWIAPVTSLTVTGTNGTVSLVMQVRNNKYGAACPMRDAIRPVMSTMFDACVESKRLGLGPPEGSTADVADCLARLRQVSRDPSNAGQLLLRVPPLASYNLNSFPASGAQCNAQGNSVLGPRFGGECISCGTYGYPSGSRCLCPSNVFPYLVGNVACGTTISSDGNVTNVASLRQWLCNEYTYRQTEWQDKHLLDHNVVKLYLDAFMLQASPIIDYVTMTQANETFINTLVFDDRKPASPTRRLGLKPNCNKCTLGYFTDEFTKTYQLVFDYHFWAMNTFRFLGYLLDQALGYPCPALWDAQNPLNWTYGYYEEVPCKEMPPGTCCSSNYYGLPGWMPQLFGQRRRSKC